ncbi:MAG: NADP-dependent oxidoreductase, partial [Pseudomonadota bacterium]
RPGAQLAGGDFGACDPLWAYFFPRRPQDVQKMPPIRPLSYLLSVYGIAGKTAFHGLLGIGRPLAGETIVVSAAAGSVGGFVGQIGKALGCRVVGIAGGPEKCAYVTEALGFDACIDYRAGGMFKALKAACVAGVDVYFDNVGGETLETVIALMNERGRIVCCGAISQYDTATPAGPRNLPGALIIKRLRMEGFIVMDFARDDDKATRALHAWVKSGQITVTEDIIDGLEHAPAALVGLLNGDNRGKRMVRVGPDPA